MVREMIMVRDTIVVVALFLLLMPMLSMLPTLVVWLPFWHAARPPKVGARERKEKLRKAKPAKRKKA